MNLSVVIPAHKEAGYIGMTLNSLQRYDGLEIVIVADLCDDATSVIARDKGARVEEVAYGNAAQARNHGFSVLEGRGKVMFLDADTVAPSGLLYQVEAALKNKGVK